MYKVKYGLVPDNVSNLFVLRIHSEIMTLSHVSAPFAMENIRSDKWSKLNKGYERLLA